jgi:hypothetical protein
MAEYLTQLVEVRISLHFRKSALLCVARNLVGKHTPDLGRLGHLEFQITFVDRLGLDFPKISIKQIRSIIVVIYDLAFLVEEHLRLLGFRRLGHLNFFLDLLLVNLFR